MAYRKSYLTGAAERARARAWGARPANTCPTCNKAIPFAWHFCVAASDARRADRHRCSVTAIARCTALDGPRILAMAVASSSAYAFACTLAVACAIAVGDWATAAQRLDSFQRGRATVRAD